jgi:hypothetical protein
MAKRMVIRRRPLRLTKWMNRLHCSLLLRLGAGNGSVLGMIGDGKFGRLAAAGAPLSCGQWEEPVGEHRDTHGGAP